MKARLSALRNVGGEFEIGRVILALASVAAIVAPIVFQAWDMARGATFDVVAWCAAYPAGLAALMAAGVLSIGSKDGKTEQARATRAATDESMKI